jgi:tRNA dimethylallyltransferase
MISTRVKHKFLSSFFTFVTTLYSISLIFSGSGRTSLQGWRILIPSMNKPKVVVITGPTAVGKSALALATARRVGAEVIGADSRQVYRFLDIGTAKPGQAEREEVVHHLLDVVNPDEHFNSACYLTQARAAIADILRQGQRVLVVGGTGLYIKVLTQGLFAGPKAEAGLRARLRLQEEVEGRGFLYRQLQAVDPEAARILHPHDTLRLIRALEVFLLSGKPISVWQREHCFQDRLFSVLTVGLVLERDELYRRIERRCWSMVEEGLVEEVERLWAMGYGPELPPLRSIGYGQIGKYLRGIMGWQEAMAEMIRETRHLAKRQLTWFRSDAEIRWFRPRQRSEIMAELERFWRAGEEGHAAN